MRYIGKAFETLKKEVKGAQAGDDSSQIPRMRVAS
jgi:hypothetical protein